MFKYLKLSSVFLLFVSCVYAQEEEIIIPSETVAVSNKDDLKNLVWNRYTTENFTILSIENEQGKWLNYNIENIKSWCLKRWGIPNFKFQKECRIMVVPNKDLLKRLFNISESRYEVRKIKDDLEVIAVWMVISSDDDLINTVPYYVTSCSLIEFNYTNNFKNDLCFINGISLLNESFSKIKNIDKKDYHTKILNLLSVDENKYNKMSSEEKKDFDVESMLLCLMFKKEFGENKFLRFLTSNKTKEDSLRYIYRFTISDFENSYNRYIKDFVSELNENKVPNSYLDVKKK